MAESRDRTEKLTHNIKRRRAGPNGKANADPEAPNTAPQYQLEIADQAGSKPAADDPSHAPVTNQDKIEHNNLVTQRRKFVCRGAR